jgi:hypothetical protein
MCTNQNKNGHCEYFLSYHNIVLSYYVMCRLCTLRLCLRQISLQKTCPLCKKALTLQQINFTLAVYICEDLECNYPVGYDCIVVERKLEDMDKNMENWNAQDEDNLNHWLDEVTAKDNNSGSLTNRDGQTCVSIDLTKSATDDSTAWINGVIEEAVSSAKKEEDTSEVTNGGDSAPAPCGASDFDDILNFINNLG